MIKNATDGCKTTKNMVATAMGEVSLLAWLMQISGKCYKKSRWSFGAVPGKQNL
jgi:hypothetical protein